INSRFAQDIDQFRDPYSAPLQNPFNAGNLIKGTTVLSMIFGGAANLQYNLRLLEAEGIINIVNGPKVMSLNGEEAEFRIETAIPTGILGSTGGGATGGQTSQVTGGTGTGAQLLRSLTISNPLNQAFQNISVSDT